MNSNGIIWIHISVWHEFICPLTMFWGGYMPEGEDDTAPWAAQETSIDWSPCVITNLEVQVFKSEVRRSRFLTETKMQLSEIGDSISDIVSVVGIVWRVNSNDKG